MLGIKKVEGDAYCQKKKITREKREKWTGPTFNKIDQIFSYFYL